MMVGGDLNNMMWSIGGGIGSIAIEYQSIQ